MKEVFGGMTEVWDDLAEILNGFVKVLERIVMILDGVVNVCGGLRGILERGLREDLCGFGVVCKWFWKSFYAV